MTSFEWSLPTRIVFGLGSAASLGKRVKGMGRRAFVVTSRSFQRGGPLQIVRDDVLAQLTKQGIEAVVFDEIEPNPRTTTIDRAATLARESKPRFIIGLGGGSVMDAAKCVALLCANDGGIWEFTYKGPGQPLRRFNHALPVVCVPTVAATSSETDYYAVVTHHEAALRTKSSIFGEALRPALSIIDPELTYSVHAQQTVDGAFDMMTHALETYFSSRDITPVQDALSEALVETVVRHLPLALENPSHTLARSQLSWCGALALSGMLSGREGGWPVHALEHGLSAITDLAHGRGLSLLLPRVMVFDSGFIPEKILRFNRRVFGTDSSDALESCQQGLFKFMRDVGAWWTLESLGIPAVDVASVSTQTIDHALRVDGILRRDRPEGPYLDNIQPIDREAATTIMAACRV